MGQKGKFLVMEDGQLDLSQYVWDDHRFADILMREKGLRGRRKRRFVHTTDSRHQHPDRAERARARFPRRRAEQGLGRRRHLHPDRDGLAVPRRPLGPLLAARRRVGDEREDDTALALAALQDAVRARRPPRAADSTVG